MKPGPNAFSLIETVIALGIFAFCIVGILGMLPVGMRAARAVSDESNAVNITSSVFGIWEMAPAGTVVFPNEIFSQNGHSGIQVGQSASNTLYFNDEGIITPTFQSASLALTYAATQTNIPGNPSAYAVNLTFRWPPNAPDGVAQTRSFSEIFIK
jgi:uncharacterized protein (TIGR02598 family)